MCLFNGYSSNFCFLPLWHLRKIRKTFANNYVQSGEEAIP